jgi:DNA-binding transcriptional LysR family regulator
MSKIDELLSVGGLSLDRLRNFCLIAEAGSLTKAADGDPGRMALYSRQIKELETFFGCELKRRAGKGIALTEAGRELARLARAHLLGLDDFKRTVRAQPQRISIAAGNSVLEWLLLPRLAELRASLPKTVFEFHSRQTSDIAANLRDLTLDLGILREDAVTAPLKARRLIAVRYALFVPAALARGLTPANLRTRMDAIPLATSLGGQFRETLEAAARKAGLSLQIIIACASFTQAARAVKSGACAAVLPTIAAAEFDDRKVREFPIPFLKEHTRQLCLAWNPRLLEVRPLLKSAIATIDGRLAHLRQSTPPLTV